MPHIEDKPIQQTCVEQLEELIRQSFIVAERLMAESAQRMGVSAAELSGAVPGVALELMQRMGNLSSALMNASPTTVDRMVGETDMVIRALTVRNKSHKKES